MDDNWRMWLASKRISLAVLESLAAAIASIEKTRGGVGIVRLSRLQSARAAKEQTPTPTTNKTKVISNQILDIMLNLILTADLNHI